MSRFKEQQGFLTIAANTEQTDYLRLAYVQALNIKATQKIKSFAVIVDSSTNQLITDEYKQVFDYIIEVPNSTTGPYGLEVQAFYYTPFKETVKLESDLLLPLSIDHWWETFRLKDIILSNGCRDYQQNVATSRKYRRLFDDNELPDVYNGLMYFRYTQTAADFFRLAAQIFENWQVIKKELKGCDDTYPSTDVVYAIAANILGRELCILPSADFINFVHMKSSINNYSESLNFTDVYHTEFTDGMIRINNLNQLHPLHYHDKNFISEEMIDYFRSMAGIN